MRAAAASNGATSMFNIGGKDPRTGRLYNFVETYAGGQGAMHNADGMDAVQCHMTNTRNAPVEVIESTYPLLIKSYGLVSDSDGPGKFRGGLGMSRQIEVLSEKTTLTVSTDRSKTKPWGVFGGLEGGNSSCTILHLDGNTEKLLYSKMTKKVFKNEVITLKTPGAGGWGDPYKRDPLAVLKDLKEELISLDRAKKFYGVAAGKTADGEYSFNIDETSDILKKSKGQENGGN